MYRWLSLRVRVHVYTRTPAPVGVVEGAPPSTLKGVEERAVKVERARAHLITMATAPMVLYFVLNREDAIIFQASDEAHFASNEYKTSVQ